MASLEKPRKIEATIAGRHRRKTQEKVGKKA